MSDWCNKFRPAIPLAYADTVCRCGVSRLNGGHGGGFARTIDLTGLWARVIARHNADYHPGGWCVEAPDGRCTAAIAREQEEASRS